MQRRTLTSWESASQAACDLAGTRSGISITRKEPARSPADDAVFGATLPSWIRNLNATFKAKMAEFSFFGNVDDVELSGKD